MGKLVLIGGGENGYHKDCYETEAIDREIVALAGRKQPHFLFVGLGNGNPDGYYGAMRRIFAKRFGCRTEYLMRQELMDTEKSKKKIDWADIIYAAGGNSLRQLRRFRENGLDILFTEKFQQSDAVFCGVSAGAICWCRYGASDAYHYKAAPEKLIKLSGLGFAELIFCPHYTTEAYRQEALRKLMRRERTLPAIGLDYAALELDNDRFRVLSLDDPRQAALCCSWQSGSYQETPLPLWEYRPLTELSKPSELSGDLT